MSKGKLTITINEFSPTLTVSKYRKTSNPKNSEVAFVFSEFVLSST